MHDRKKKHGQRKDKKNQKMHEAVEVRHENAGPKKPPNQQKDIITFKQGGPTDKTVSPQTRATSARAQNVAR